MTSLEILGTVMQGRTISIGNKTYRLVKPLGSGATAVVFQGKATDDHHKVAIKLTLDKKTAKDEINNLLALNNVQKSYGQHVFPEIYYPQSESDCLEHHFYVGRGVAGVADGRVSAYVLIQELVSGEGVHDMLLHFSDTLSLPEPLALAIARQYATLLSLAHEANITSWDRKLGDLRWQWKIDPVSYAKEDILAAWKKDDIGNLMVIDWNVTHEASMDAIAKDMFRFGLLWHRMLLGVEPKFKQGATWQLLEPLESHAAWETLSSGVQRILSKLLHPDPNERYHNAKNLERDLEKVIKGWQTSPKDLAHDILSVYGGLESKLREDIQSALALADILILRRDLYSEKNVEISDSASLDQIQIALRRALRFDNDSALRNFISAAAWARALKRIDDLKRNLTLPIELLHASRLHFVISKARDYQWKKSDSVARLKDFSSVIYEYDTSSTEDRDETLGKMVEKWKGFPSSEGEWAVVRDAFVVVARYRLRISVGMRAYSHANYRTAKDDLGEAIALRSSILATIGKEHLALLDKLFGDPESIIGNINSKLESENERNNLIKRGMGIFLSGVREQQGGEDKANLDTIEESIRVYQRQHPQDIVITRLLYLLEVHQPYADVKSSALSVDLARRMLVLEQSRQAWNKLREVADEDEKLDMKRKVKETDNWFEKEWQSIKGEIIFSRLTTLVAEHSQEDAAAQGWWSGTICWMYNNVREDLEFQDKVENHLKKLGKKFSKLKSDLNDKKDEFDQATADQLLATAALGYNFVQAYGREVGWEAGRSPDKTREFIEQKRKLIEEVQKKTWQESWEKSFLRAIYETALLSFEPVLLEEKS